MRSGTYRKLCNGFALWILALLPLTGAVAQQCLYSQWTASIYSGSETQHFTGLSESAAGGAAIGYALAQTPQWSAQGGRSVGVQGGSDAIK